MGHAGTVLATQDGGRSWALRLDGRRAAVRPASSEREGPDKPWLDLPVTGPRRAVVVGAYGLAFETRDGGHGWTSWRGRLPNPKELHVCTVRAAGTRVVMAGEQGLVMVSGDDGARFRRLETPYRGSQFIVEMPDEQQIVLAGLRGQAWRSRDGGNAWQSIASPANASITGSARGAGGTLLFVHQAGQVLAAAGESLRALPGPLLPPLNGIVALDDGSLLALSIQGVDALAAPAR